jgi:hypothetical protein
MESEELQKLYNVLNSVTSGRSDLSLDEVYQLLTDKNV